MASDRVARIRERLETAFSPVMLDIADESSRHARHAGASDGRGHFRIRISSQSFVGKRPLERHRMVYAALGSMMATDIHAVSVIADVPAVSADSEGN